MEGPNLALDGILPKKPRFRPDEVVVCWEGFAAQDVPFPFGVVRRGTRLRGGHPVVQSHSWRLVADGVPEIEWPKREFPEPEQHEPMIAVVEQIPDDEAAVANCDLTCGFGGPTVKKGQRLRRDVRA
jgi:hypothetical protein